MGNYQILCENLVSQRQILILHSCTNKRTNDFQRVHNQNCLGNKKDIIATGEIFSRKMGSMKKKKVIKHKRDFGMRTKFNKISSITDKCPVITISQITEKSIKKKKLLKI